MGVLTAVGFAIPFVIAGPSIATSDAVKSIHHQAMSQHVVNVNDSVSKKTGGKTSVSITCNETLKKKCEQRKMSYNDTLTMLHFISTHRGSVLVYF